MKVDTLSLAYNPYDLKRHCIENSLYGVDIDPGAVEICKLRFWLSLIVDEEEFHNIKPLPNLDYKIVNGNSLLNFPENWESDISQKIEKLERLYFSETDPEKKKEFKRELDELIQRRLANSEQYFGYKINFDFRLFFPQIFRQKGGFDVVIANPPFVRQERIKEQKPLLRKAGYEVYNSTSDLYTYFYEKSYQILKANGFSCFISSNKWMRAKYGEKLRRFFKEKTTLKKIIDFNGYKVFGATVDTNIVLFQKEKPSENSVDILNIKQGFTPSTDITDYFKEHKLQIKQSELDTNCFTFGDEAVINLKKKIEYKGIPLKNWDVKIYRGITTGLNQVFIIDEPTKNELVKKDRKSLEVLKPILRGKDVNKWFYEFKGFYLIYAYTGIDIKKYQAIYEYLKQYKNKLDQVWEAKYNKKAWYELRGCDYYEEFEKEKIVWADINIENSFSLDNKNIFLSNTGYILTGKNLKYLLAIINSSIQNFYFKQISQNLGEKGYRYIYEFVEKLPIPKIPESEQKPFITLVDKILAITKDEDYLQNSEKQAKVREYEKEIDQMVYKLYGLIEDEIKIVEGHSNDKIQS